jgi:hypothetical protein
MRRRTILNLLSPVLGKLGCMAFQVQRKMVAKQLHRRPTVPRPRGSGAQPMMSAVEFIAVVNSSFVACFLQACTASSGYMYVYLHDEAETLPACRTKCRRSDAYVAVEAVMGDLSWRLTRRTSQHCRCSRKLLWQCAVI